VREKRRRIWIDRFQTYLFLRIAGYFICYQIAVWALLVIEHHMTETLGAVQGGPATNSFYLVRLVGLALLAFLFIYDAISVAHRLVGPIYRFRKAIKAIAAGEEVPLITLRKGDFLLEMKDEFNEMLQVLADHGAVKLKDNSRPAESQACAATAK
jgi:nitrogen fixation/metabolism regulation signal transduction histidine kinase